MKKLTIVVLTGLLMISAAPSKAELYLDGFLQGLYGGSTEQDDNPTETEYTSAETRMQMRAQHIGDRAEFFGRLDFVYDATRERSNQYDWELREGFLKFRLGDNFDFKVGRQVLTWGTGDLVFINDVFAKDYVSFFIGRDDQYLKAPQNALRAEYYSKLGSLTLIWTPRFEPNRLPTGERLSYFLPPMPDGMGGVQPGTGLIVGTGLDESYYFEPPLPEAKFHNSEIAGRFQRRIGYFSAALYGYRGFYKNPTGFDPMAMTAYYPKLNVFGASIRGPLMGGIIWLEGGYFDSREDRDGDNPTVPNSSILGLFGFERQVATDLTANIQWQVDYMTDYDTFKAQQIPGVFVRDEVRHLLTSRVTRKLSMETITLSGFVFYSPTDKDVYFRGSVEYKYTDNMTLALGANVFDGNHPNTDFGQFALNDNVYTKMTYGF